MSYRDIAFAIGLSLTSIGAGCAGTTGRSSNVTSVSAAAEVLNAKPDEVFRAGDYFLTNATYQKIRWIAAIYKGSIVTVDGDKCGISSPPAAPGDTGYIKMAVQYVAQNFVPKGSNIMTYAQAQKARDTLCRQKAGSEQ